MLNSLINLSKFLIKKYKIDQKNILGHSDIAPNRKKDPGEKFPWKYLAKFKIADISFRWRIFDFANATSHDYQPSISTMFHCGAC